MPRRWNTWATVQAVQLDYEKTPKERLVRLAGPPPVVASRRPLQERTRGALEVPAGATRASAARERAVRREGRGRLNSEVQRV